MFPEKGTVHQGQVTVEGQEGTRSGCAIRRSPERLFGFRGTQRVADWGHSPEKLPGHKDVATGRRHLFCGAHVGRGERGGMKAGVGVEVRQNFFIVVQFFLCLFKDWRYLNDMKCWRQVTISKLELKDMEKRGGTNLEWAFLRGTQV